MEWVGLENLTFMKLEKTTMIKLQNQLLLLTLPTFPSKNNIIPDILSCGWHLSDSDILKLLTSLFPSQLHPDFNLSPLPKEIESLIFSILLLLPQREEQQKAHKTSGFVHGECGKNSFPASALKEMTSWKHLMNGTDKLYASALPKLSKMPNLLDQEQKTLLLQQSLIPSVM